MIKNMRSAVMPIVGVTVVFFLLQLIIPGFTEFFILFPNTVFFEPWTLITHMFLHSPENFFHIFINMFMLLMFGQLLEQRIGTGRFLALYFGGGIIAGIAFVALELSTSGELSSVLGASGAVMAVLGTLIVFMPRLKVFVMFIPIPISLWIVGVFFILIDLFGLTWAASPIAHISHLGGIAVGLFAGLYWKRMRRKYQKGFSMKSHLNDDDIEQYMRRGRL